MRRSLSAFKITPALLYPPHHAKRFHASTSQLTTASLNPIGAGGGFRDTPLAMKSSLQTDFDAGEIIRKQKLADLQNTLARRSPGHLRVWLNYVEALEVVGRNSLPLEVHQAVLRKCVPSPSLQRSMITRRAAEDRMPRIPHLYEARLKTVMRNIRATGHIPALSDYHFILAQFAAVGHFQGAKLVYNEAINICGLTPLPKTFGLCLQAIAHRLALPLSNTQRNLLIPQCTEMCRGLLQDMSNYKFPVTSVNPDLAIRIFKETLDSVGFNQLMKLGYAIDLDYPDRPPVESLEPSNPAVALPSPQPFSTAALNTAIDTLGRFNNPSRLVQAFEVLTTPLPPQASQHFSKEFDEEDDDFGNVNPASTNPWEAPSADPNTTTYHLLLKHLSRSGHATFARHYLFRAYELDRQYDRELRSALTKGTAQISAPQLSMRRRLILPVFGEANRDKNMELLRWVGWITRQSLRRKKNDLAWYIAFAEELSQKYAADTVNSPESGSDPPAAPPCFENELSKPATSSSVDAPLPRPWENTTDSIFRVDLDASVPDSSSSQPMEYIKHFDMDLHLNLLRRDIDELTTLRDTIEVVTERSTQRVKERLGRRIWEAKNVYLLTEDQRVSVSRERWVQIVNFRKKGYEVRPGARPIRERVVNKWKDRQRILQAKVRMGSGWLGDMRGLDGGTTSLINRTS